MITQSRPCQADAVTLSKGDRHDALSILFVVLLLSGPAAAQDLSFQIAPTESCLWDSGNTGEKRACIGRAAAACMEQPGGSSTVAMGFCLDQELAYWDDMLNDAYGQFDAGDARG